MPSVTSTIPISSCYAKIFISILMWLDSLNRKHLQNLALKCIKFSSQTPKLGHWHISNGHLYTTFRCFDNLTEKTEIKIKEGAHRTGTFKTFVNRVFGSHIP